MRCWGRRSSRRQTSHQLPHHLQRMPPRSPIAKPCALPGVSSKTRQPVKRESAGQLPAMARPRMRCVQAIDLLAGCVAEAPGIEGHRYVESNASRDRDREGPHRLRRHRCSVLLARRHVRCVSRLLEPRHRVGGVLLSRHRRDCAGWWCVRQQLRVHDVQLRFSRAHLPLGEWGTSRRPVPRQMSSRI